MCQTPRVLRKLHLLLLGSLPIVGAILLPAFLENRAIAQDQQCSSWRDRNLDLIDRKARNPKQRSPIYSIAFNRDGSFLAVGNYERKVEIWDVKKILNDAIKTPRKTLEFPQSEILTVRFSPDGKILAGGGSNGKIRVWDWQKGITIRTLTQHSKAVASILFSQNGQFLISGSRDQTVKIWNLKTGEIKNSWTEDREIQKLALSPDARTLAVVSLNGGEIKFRNWQTGASIGEIGKFKHPMYQISDAVFSPNGKTLAFSPFSSPIDQQPNQVCLWNVQNDRLEDCLSGHTAKVSSLAFSPDGHCLISGSSDQSVKVWRVASRQLAYDLNQNLGIVLSVSFSPNGRLFAAGSHNGSFNILRYKQ
jgi:WD40 repeat protein